MTVRLAIRTRAARLPLGNAASAMVRSASSARRLRAGEQLEQLGGRFESPCHAVQIVPGMRSGRSTPAVQANPEAKLSWSFSANTLTGIKPIVPVFAGATFEADTSAGRRCMR
jgi:hypothetical protein